MFYIIQKNVYNIYIYIYIYIYCICVCVCIYIYIYMYTYRLYRSGHDKCKQETSMSLKTQNHAYSTFAAEKAIKHITI